MSFRDSAGLKAADCKPEQSTSELDTEVCAVLACDGAPPTASCSRVNPPSAPADFLRGLERDAGSSGALAAFSPKRKEANGQAVLPAASAAASGDVYTSDAASIRSGLNWRGSSGCGSVSSARRGVNQLSSRIIYPSAPITFLKALPGCQAWGAYTRTPHGYLNAEAVRAAAAVDERRARGEPEVPRRRIIDHSVGDEDCHRSQTAAAGDEKHPQEGGSQVQLNPKIAACKDLPEMLQAPGSVGSSGHAMGSMEEQFQAGVAAAGAAAGMSRSACTQEEAAGVSSSTRRRSHRVSLRGWFFGGGDAGTEIERLLKEEHNLTEAVTARSELAERKLLQEDMEAMINNLQQVKTFLVQKLQECESALLTTAQERDDMELTLQHIQSGIRDSVAENRLLVEDLKKQLAAKESEVEVLRAQLAHTTEEAERLREGNKTLLSEVAVARAEIADSAAARGFHIEEYRAAIQTLMERNKAQHRELRRLRAQLIKTREDYANSLARIDELESLADYQKSLVHAPQPDTPAGRHRSGWRIPKVLHAGRRSSSGTDGSERAFGRSRSASGQPPGALSQGNYDEEECESSPDSTAFSHGRESGGNLAFAGENAEAHLSARGSCAYTPEKRTGPVQAEPTASPDTPSAATLGRSVTGLLASGVSRVLQHFEHAIASDREKQETSDQEEEGCGQLPPAPASLHEEAALFVHRTSHSSDIVVHLEDGQDLQQSGEEEGMGETEAAATETSSSTLGNVARSVWQAAHEMLADRALPPARLSTLRTIAASNPSAWEVILERHRAVKSMPLFSSIPPAAYSLVAEAKMQHCGVSATGSDVALPGGSARNNRSHSSGSARTLPRRVPLAAALNTRPSGRTRRELQSREAVSLELHCQPVAGSAGQSASELVVWREERRGGGTTPPSSPNHEAPGDAEEGKSLQPEIMDNPSAAAPPTCGGGEYKEERNDSTESERNQGDSLHVRAPVAECQAKSVESHTPVAEPQVPVVESHTPVAESQALVAESHTPVAEPQAPVAGRDTPV